MQSVIVVAVAVAVAVAMLQLPAYPALKTATAHANETRLQLAQFADASLSLPISSLLSIPTVAIS